MDKLTDNQLKLHQLIYGLNNTIIVTSKDYTTMIEQIELVRSGSTIAGFIFRNDFADSEKLTEYSEATKKAILAQYSLTYGWANDYKTITTDNPVDVLDAYFEGVDQEIPHIIKSDTSYFLIDNPSKVYTKVTQDLANSKIPLRSHQKQILELIPKDIVLNVFQNTTFTIKETEILFAVKLLKEGSQVQVFKDPQQIVRFLVMAYSSFDKDDLQLNKAIVKGIKLKIPTSMRKALLKELNGMNVQYALQRMKPMLQFWKRIFKQLTWTNDKAMDRRYPKAMIIKTGLYEGTIQTPQSKIQAFQQKGDLSAAFKLEMKNPGQMARSLLFYLRYTKGSKYATKFKKNKPKVKVGDYFGKEYKGIVTSDIHIILKSKEFKDTLTKTNTKLLWQLLDLIKDERWQKLMTSRTVNGKRIKYKDPLPGLNSKLVKLAKNAIKEAIKIVKEKENESLGKVYIDKECKNYNIQMSGRTETDISLSGEYLTPGSKINFADMLKGKEDYIIRAGIAWKGKTSCDIDLSLSVRGENAIFHGKPTLTRGDKVLITSSGDITSNNNSQFSTEFIDLDINACKEQGLTDMFSSMIMYAGSTFNNYELYWFMQVIPRAQRVMAGRTIKIQLDDMDYAIKVESETRAQLGMLYNLEKGYMEVLNYKASDIISQRQTANTFESRFKTMLEERPKMSTIYKVLKKSINKNQLVDKPEDADIIISPIISGIEDNQILLHPGRDSVDIQQIIF